MPRPSPPPARVARPGFTLLELLLTLAIIGIVSAAAVLPMRWLRDGQSVRQASRETVAAFAAARRAAIRFRGATVRIDSAGVRLTAQDTTVRTYEFRQRLGVRVQTNTGTLTFGSTGLARGVGNGTIVLSRGQRTDTVVVSRLGRVRD